MACTFISHPAPFVAEYTTLDPAPLFRRHFTVKSGLQKAMVDFCPLGIGVAYLNGQPMTNDLFLTPTSDYQKTLWYTRHDITHLLTEGENLLAVVLGNGFYNECLKTSWDFDVAPWRDVPKLWLKVTLTYADGEETLTTDEAWLCEKENSPYRFNQYRAGEIYDANFATNWYSPCFDDSNWVKAVIAKAPTGQMRLHTAPPVREDRTYAATELFLNRQGDWVYDFAQNMSGYLRLKVNQPKGTQLYITYAEDLDADGGRKNNTLTNHYRTQTQFSQVVSAGEPFVWQPQLSYSGFRYVIISGAKTPLQITDAQGVFVHQDFEILSDFHCSNKIFEKLFRLSRISSLSNLFYIPTDCPTREKLGWCNDMQASCEQMLQNMDTVCFFKKWLQDILDAMRPDGDLPGIVPTGGWGYAWGSGPISSGILFEIPARLYQYTGQTEPFQMAYKAMRLHLNFLEGKRNPQTGLCAHGLHDWAGPFKPENPYPTPLELTCTALLIKFYRIAARAAAFANDAESIPFLNQREAELTALYKQTYLLPNGRCSVDEQAAVAMTIALGLHNNLAPLKQQLKEVLQKYDNHLHVGMLGIQYLLPACDICGLQESVYTMLAAGDYPSYGGYFAEDATTMFEMFHGNYSLNHHMYTCVIAWFHNTLLGICQTEALALEGTITLKPFFAQTLRYANGSFKTVTGTLRVDWQRSDEEKIDLYVDIPQNVQATLELTDYCTEQGEQKLTLQPGRNTLCLISKTE